MAQVKNLTIQQGATFTQLVRWGVLPIVYKPITAIPNTAPATLTVPAHGVPAGWNVAVTAVKGMTGINALASPPATTDYHAATVVDANTIVLDDVNAALYKAYTSGGYVQYYTPQPLTGFTARMAIKDKVGGTQLLRLDTSTTPIRITIDTANSVITLSIAAADTLAITWTTGVYDLELVSAAGVVTTLLSGTVTITPAVTTT
jgi:hypothetical protein